MKSFLRYTALLLSWLPSLVSADTCTANAPTPASYTVVLGNNPSPNTPISDWLMLAEQHWTCVKTGHNNEDEAADDILDAQNVFVMVPTANPTSFIEHEGKLYRLYTSKIFVEDPFFPPHQIIKDISFIVRRRQSIGGLTYGSWKQMLTPPLEADMSGMPNEAPVNIGESYLVTAQVEVKLFSTTNMPYANNVFNMRILRAELANNTSNTGGQSFQQEWRLIVNFPRRPDACTTPDLNVTLPPVGMNLFPSVGSTGPATAFAIRFDNCPHWLDKVEYKFQSVPHQTISNGVLPVSNGKQPLHPGDYDYICNADYSSCGYDVAFGYGVQILDGNQPLVFDTWRTLNYSVLHGPNYTVPLGARIIRTHQHTQPGLIRVYMNMSVRYQ